MSLEKKLTDWSGYTEKTFSRFLRRLGEYSLMLGIAFSGANYGCGKQEDEDNSVQRYNCAMNECLPDPNGPYAVADCNNECGAEKDGGNGQQIDYFNVTKDGMPECEWGGSAGAAFSLERITVGGTCKDIFKMEFSPVPPPSGGSAPCTRFYYGNNDYPKCGSRDNQPVNVAYNPVNSGSLTLTGSSGRYRVKGDCNCITYVDDTNPPEVLDNYTAEFDLPLEGTP